MMTAQPESFGRAVEPGSQFSGTETQTPSSEIAAANPRRRVISRASKRRFLELAFQLISFHFTPDF